MKFKNKIKKYMWGASSLSNRYQSNTNKAQCPIQNPNSLPEYNMLYQTPIKQFEYQQNNNNFTATPFRFDFNHYFGNLWSSGKMPNNQLLQPQMFLSPTQLNKDNLPLNKKSIEESYKLTPLSQLKYSNSSNNSSNNSNNNNNNNIINKGNNNNGNVLPNNVLGNNNINNNNLNNLNYFNGYNNINISNNTNNKNNNDIAKKNLNELFNNAKNDNSLYDKEKMKFINNFNNFNNCNIINNINHYSNTNMNNTNYINERKRFNRNCNLQISRQFIFSSPLCTTKPKKIFECSGSTLASMNSNKNPTTPINNKNRRFRKNNEQISLLKKFYNEHKHWSKNQIKEISQKIGLKENKVYKWLWDQRNKEIKATKFVVKKDMNKNLKDKDDEDELDEKDDE